MTTEPAPDGDRPEEDPTCAGRVVVVDDEPTIIDVATAVLVEAGFAVEGAESAERCLELVGAGEYDAVLTDVHMGAMDGIELTGRLRLGSPDTRVVVMTANDDYDTVRAALAAGAYDYLDKPLNRHKLLTVTIGHAVRAARRARAHAAERRALKARVAELELGEARLRALVGAMRKALHVDERTGLASRRGVHERLGAALRARGAEPLSVAHIELDGYARTLQAHGVAGADAALAELVRLLRLNAARMDLAGHLGDGRFVAVLPGLGAEAASTWAARLGDAVREEARIETAPGETLDVGIGLASVEDEGAPGDARELLERARRALDGRGAGDAGDGVAEAGDAADAPSPAHDGEGPDPLAAAA